MNLLSSVAYCRPNAPEVYRFKKIGRLLYDQERHRAKLLLYGFRQGMCVAKCWNGPFLQGDIVYPAILKQSQTVMLFVGFICTTENEAGETVYTITLEAAPLKPPSQLWLNINLDDDPEYKPTG